MHIKIKQLNNVIKSTFISLFGLLLLAGFVTSCSFDSSDQSAESSTKTTTVNFSLDETSRNILPVVDINNDLLVTKITYKKTDAETDTEAVEIMAEADGKKITDLRTYEDIPAGEELTFEATAKIGQLVYEAVTVETLRAGIINSVTLNFELAETNDNFVAQEDEKGNISIGIKVIDDNVTTVKAKLTKYDGTVVEENVDVALSSKQGTYEKNEVLAGTYKIAFTLYNGSLKLGEHTALINVVKDKKSSPVSALELDGNDIYSITYKNFKTDLLQEGIVLQTSCTRFSNITLPGAAFIGKDGLKTFDGWYDNEELSGTPVTQLSDVRDNVVLYAKWNKLSLESEKLSLSGNLIVGETLTALYNGTSADTTYINLQWYRADTNDETEPEAISGATGATYTLTADDGNKYIYVKLTGDGDTYVADSIMAVTSDKIHAHTFDMTRWVFDASGHWHPVTCEHNDVKNSFTSHQEKYIEKDGKCVRACEYCDYNGAPQNHTWGSYTITDDTHTSTCQKCNTTSTGSHTYEWYDNGSNHVERCNSCNKESGRSAPHTNWRYVPESEYSSEYEFMHSKICVDCEHIDLENHTPGENNKCRDCGGPIHVHSYSYSKLNKTDHYKDCTGCADSWNEEHTFGDDDKCTKCGEERCTHPDMNYDYDEEDEDYSVEHFEICYDCGHYEWVYHTFTNGVCACGALLNYSTCRVGDFVLKDGTLFPRYRTPESGSVAAVIVRAAGDGKPTLGVGIALNNEGLAWCSTSAEGRTNLVTSLLGTKTEGYMDGSDGWTKLKAVCSDAAAHPEYYPAWNYSLTYGATNSLTGDMAKGWYLPTMAELDSIYQNVETINASLTKAGGDNFITTIADNGCYLSCNEVGDCELGDGFVYGTWFGLNGAELRNEKHDSRYYVCSVKVFE